MIYELHNRNPFGLQYPDNGDKIPFASKITDNIWIGNIYDGMDEAYQQSLGIDAIINVMGSPMQVQLGPILVRPVFVPPMLSYSQFPLNQPFGDTLPLAQAAVKKLEVYAKKAGFRVLVHCLSGRDRSVSVVWKYLVDIEKKDEQVAELMIKNIRPFAIIHKDWW